MLGATGRRHAAVPALDFDVHVTEPGGRQVYAIALTAQVMIEPARRAYDAETREQARRAVRRRPSAGPPPRAASSGTRPTCSCPAFTGSTTFRVPVPASFDMEVASAKYLYGLPDGEVPLAFNFNGTVHYRGDDGRLQVSLVPWSCSAEFRLPVATWRELIEHYYPQHRLDRAAGRRRCGRSSARRRAARCRRSTPAWRSCSRSGRERRRARRLAALRGLRALPVHAGRDQERDAHAVRHRLPARVRAHARHDLRPPRAPVRRGGRRRGHAPRSASSRRAASATGRSRSGSRARASSASAGSSVRTRLDGDAARRRPAAASRTASRTAPTRPAASTAPARSRAR